MPDNIVNQADLLFQRLESLPLRQKVDAINRIRQKLHSRSPFSEEPVDCVQWLPAEEVEGNDYNPNSVAPPELRLLKHSIEMDGFTQPIVAHAESTRHLVVDGFHRHYIGKTSEPIRLRIHGYLPIVHIRSSRGDLPDRIASTIRHNRARGVHGVQPMTDVVVALRNAGWNDECITRNLGMDPEEVLRFKQVAGLPELFSSHEYSRSWD
ncbi:IbrB-like domain-containing protein [Achromobacter insolitus]|uniref:IbrB-like domain-containing protein n=1 Tax=Achromobacter insolitus TaxID=217204 RepID=UPI00241CFF66|nr:ParB/RepB/Spo0J family partition protein [Achromobacter insolitus]